LALEFVRSIVLGIRRQNERRPVPRFALLLVVAAVALLAAAPTNAGPAATPTKLTGTVGPGFTITLKRGGVRVRTLKAGRYSIRVTDRSDVHDFWLKGPVRRNITGVGFQGTKTVTLTLRKGSYTYYCAIHPPMKAGFRVT
jgi:hypothetical protein